MAFADLVTQDRGQYRILVEIDIADINSQWINAGAGIWYVSATNTYPEVDNTLLDGFTAQEFGIIGSVRSDGLALTGVDTLAEVTTTPTSFYYDLAEREVFVRLQNYDDPRLHEVRIGVVYGYSRDEFIPIGFKQLYEGRLIQNPAISAKRDPLFFGRIVFKSAAVRLLNGDGEFDRFGIDNDVYGNEARILLGFDSIDYDEYETLFTGYVEKFTVGEDEAAFTITDRRKQLTKPITYSCTELNALTAIEEILEEAYGYPYSDTYYDTTAWDAAKDQVEDITIDMQEPEPVIDVIEDIATSVFGLFRVTPDNLFTFRIVDTDDTIEALIQSHDVLNAHRITYNPTEVISSIRVGYDKDWVTSGTAYTYYEDTSREASVFSAYKTYNQKTFNTLLTNLTAATAFASTVLDYTDTVRGVETIEVPLEHYSRDLGDIIGVEIQRGDEPMIGEYKAEVVSIETARDEPVVKLGIRHGTVIEDVRETEEEEIRITEADEIRMVD